MNIFYLPDLGEGLPDAEIHQWFVKEGDDIKADQPMVAMETAKAVVEVPAPQSGKVAKLFGKKGDVIQTGAPLIGFAVEAGALIENEIDEDEAAEATATVVGAIPHSTEILTENATGIKPQKSNQDGPQIMPAVRLLAKQLQIDISTLKGTGPNGRITAADVQQAKRQREQKGSASSAVPTNTAKVASQGEPLRGVRRAMATIMSQSHAQIVPVTITDDADLHAWGNGNDITLRVIRAIIHGVKTEPAINAWFYTEDLARQLHENINIGLAMDSSEGLFVPVLQNVGKTEPAEWRKQINQFKEQVKNRAIPQEALRGATIMLTNFGVFAGRYATPVLAPPCVAILGTGKLRQEARVADEKIVAHPILPLSLTVDHRAVTGGEAARFLAAVIADLQTAE